MDVAPRGTWVPIRSVLAARGERMLLAAAAAGTALLYSLLLPASYTQRVSFANWRFLNPELAVFSAAFGLTLGWVVCLQVYAARRAGGGAGRGATVLAALVGFLPNLLCCTPVVPTVLALAGVSVAGVYGLSGQVQGFFARQEHVFLLGSLALVCASALWCGRRVAEASCPACRGDGDTGACQEAGR